ncbi:MAG: T9SS type A sorting domain-containing protein [Bacteroidota bacterium]
MRTITIQLLSSVLFLSVFIFNPSSHAQWEILGERNFLPGETFRHGLQFKVAEGTPYIAYVDIQDNRNIKVLKYNGNDWDLIGQESIPTGRVSYPSLLIHEGLIYLAYQDLDFDDKSSLIRYDGVSWDYVGQRGFSEGEARFQSVVIHNNEPYVAFEDVTQSRESTVMKYNGSDWVIVGNPGFTSGISDGQSIYNQIVTNQEELYIIFCSVHITMGEKTWIMKFEDETWSTVGNSGFRNAGGARQSLVFLNNEPYCTYLNFSNSKAAVKKYNGNQWVTVGQLGLSEGLAPSPTMHIHNDIPYVAYSDFSEDTKLTVMYLDGDNWAPLGGIGVSPADITLPEIEGYENTIYVAFIDAQNPNPGNVTIMTYDLLTTVDDRLTEISQFDIFPNPASEHLTISTTETIDFISIVSLEGRLIKRSKTTNHIDLDGIPKGTYLLQIKTDKGTGYKRFVKR